MGIDLPDGTLLRGVTIKLEKDGNVDVGGSACVFLEDVIVLGGGISVGGGARITLKNVTVRGAERALDLGGGAQAVVDGGSYEGKISAITMGGDAVATIHGVDASAPTALMLGGAASVFVDAARIQCPKASAFDECVSIGGSANVLFHGTDVDAEGRAVSVGGGAHVTLDGGAYTTRAVQQIEMATLDVMGGAALTLRDVAVHGESRALDRGGAGTLTIESGTFEPPLPAALCH